MNNNLNEIFGERYLKFCTWIPVVAIVCLLASTTQDQNKRLISIYIAGVLLLGNAVYIIYKFARHKMSEKCKNTFKA